MNLVIDIGNTVAKLAVFEENKLIWAWTAGTPLSPRFFPKKKFQLSNSICSMVVNTPDAKKLFKLLTARTRLIKFSHKTPLPFVNRYKTPATLGLDRLAAITGAWKRFPKKNVLVIDAGTCIKYDFINEGGEYLGGSISPGLNMRFEALHNFTDRLPLISPERVKMVTGNSTKDSILSGVVLGMNSEINGFIALYKANYKNLKVILTGGDAAFLGRPLKSSIFAAPYLTLEGLNEILQFNADKN